MQINKGKMADDAVEEIVGSGEDAVFFEGKYNTAIAYNSDIEEYAKAQIRMICDDETAKGSSIRVMPDVHPGMVGPIGLTMTVGDKLIPNLLGVDIGCGISCYKLSAKRIEFQRLDKVIRERVPSGFDIREKANSAALDFDLSELRCIASINEDKAQRSLGTLGGGNHFIEIDRDDEGTLYLVIHTGSRHLGKEVCDLYVKKGAAVLKEQGIERPYEMTWLAGGLMQDYIHDVLVVREYAALNRELIARVIIKGLNLKATEHIDCCHNYIDYPGDGRGILRKGAISAVVGEKVIIPVNMKDGIILGVGKGNKDWNESAPHGSGRVLARNQVRDKCTVASFKKEMADVYCSCISAGTLDESPFAYRRLEAFADKIKPSVEISKILRPIYNYKAGSR